MPGAANDARVSSGPVVSGDSQGVLIAFYLVELRGPEPLDPLLAN